ncbi:MAG: hypothetical protein K0S32_225 [Bacteroidetes bacterium]|nr:hypothetical protein [Bacteroidota bacterium]
MIWLVVIAGIVVLSFRIKHTMNAIKKYGNKDDKKQKL